MATEFEEKFFQESYESEIDRMYKLDASVSFPAAIITLLGGWIVFYAQSFPSASWNIFFLVFALFFFAVIGIWIAAVYYLIRSYVGFNYDLVSRTDKVAEFLNGLRAHYGPQNLEPDKMDEAVDSDLREFLVEQYQSAAATGRVRNMERIRWSYRCNLSLISCLIGLAITVIPFLIIYEKKPQRVDVVSAPSPLKVEMGPGVPVYRVEVGGTVQLQQPPPQVKP